MKATIWFTVVMSLFICGIVSILPSVLWVPAFILMFGFFVVPALIVSGIGAAIEIASVIE